MRDADESAVKQEENRRLCERYPFLIPRNRFSGMRITEAGGGGYWPGSPDEIPEYDYEYTELDAMPAGWRIAFGEQMLEELREELAEHGLLDKYMITQIKEKWGFLHWYDCGNTIRGCDIIEKYAGMSKQICIGCGKPAAYISSGWISPWCEECAKSIQDRLIPIEEYYNKEGTD